MSRNSDIVRLRETGATYAAISKKYGLSVERVRQICRYHWRDVRRDIERHILQAVLLLRCRP